MPHSSGGGSSGGGSHGGHSGGSGRSRRVKSTSFPGSKRYLYYKDGQPQFVYANYDVTQKKSPLRFFILLFYLPFVAIIVWWLVTGAVTSPKKIKADYDDSILIDDRIEVLGDTDRMEEALEEFRSKTGIAPAVITVENSKWQGNYTNLENYAYDVYVNTFDDEYHWLIMYSTDGDSDEWYWEGMQGDETDPVITEKQADKFTKFLQKEFKKDDVDRADAIAAAFEEITPGIMKTEVHIGVIIASVLILAFLGVHAFFMLDIHPKRDKELEKAIECNDDVIRQETCNYCGGVYVVGHHLYCPHCQAPVRAHDYTVDEDGRVTGILN